MKKLIFLLFMVLASGLVACSAAQPDISVSDSFDLGQVPWGETAVAELPVRNIGAGTLTVAAVSTSCGCTTASLSAMSIPPGSEATLHVEYDSTAHGELVGPVERHVFIASDDPDEEEVQIILTVFVQDLGGE